MADSTLQVGVPIDPGTPPRKAVVGECVLTNFSTVLQDRLRDHAKAFDGLLSLIPSKMYYGEDTSVCRFYFIPTSAAEDHSPAAWW